MPRAFLDLPGRDWLDRLEEPLRNYVHLERVRGPQLMARFYAEANFRALAAQHDPPFTFGTFAQVNEGMAFVQEFEDLLMPWTFGDQTLVPQTVSSFDRMAPASSVFGDVLRYDGALYLAMRWAYAPGPKGDFDPMHALLRDSDFYRDIEQTLRLSDKSNLDLAFRFLNGTFANEARGRLEVYDIISGLQKHMQRQNAPLTGRQMLELIFEQLHPRHLSRDEKDKLWRSLARTCVNVLSNWDSKVPNKSGRISQLCSPDSPVMHTLLRYIRNVRTAVHSSMETPRFPTDTLWTREEWSVPSVYTDRVPRMAAAEQAFTKLTAEYADDVKAAAEGGVPLPPEVLDELFIGLLPPPDDIDQYSPFFHPTTSPMLFCCGCVFAYLRLGIAGFIVPETMNIAGTRVPSSIKEKKTQKMKNAKLAVTTQFWILRAYQTNNSDRLLQGGSETITIIEKLRQLQAHWVLASTKGDKEEQQRAQDFIRTISAVIRESPWTGQTQRPPDIRVEVISERLQNLKVND